MAQTLANDLEGWDRVRFLRYQIARSVQFELRKGVRQGRTVEELAGQYGLLAEEVSMVLYAGSVRCTARV